MSLTPGARLGSYEIVSQLGVGGMGEVYRARDSQLKRDVAIKILPADVTADADRLARFQREAEILASLNHANIAQVFGIAEANGIRGIVMELAEGETLAQMLALGPLTLGEALGIARQIAEALEMAHDRGIVHRDLKPANVMMTPDGVVKVLDFGLAKALTPATDAKAQAATFSSPAMTRAGIILGTAGYMSPEQARGRVVDARTDIWASGCVLFEMLSGRRPFDGETVTDILGAIVHKEPDWSVLPAALPDSLRRLLERCLAKDPKQRVHNIADVRLEIEDLLMRPRSGGGATGVAIAAPARAPMAAREIVAWGLAVVSLVATASAVWLLRPAPSPIVADRPMRLSILHTEGSEVGIPAISPDGRRVAYPARGADGIPMIWVRDLGVRDMRSGAVTKAIFTSSDTGRDEVSVTTFPERRQTWSLTTDGGSVLSWSADGREILVATLSGHIVAYPVSTSGGNFSAGAPQVLIRNVGFEAQFARATRDHSRILVRVPKDADKDRGEIRLLFGWAKGLGGRP